VTVARPPVAGGLEVRLRGVIHLYQQEGPDVVALRGVDLDITAGEMVALLGPSGMGKSTLLQLLAGMMRPSSGVILLDSVDLGTLGSAEIQVMRATDVSYVMQEPIRNLLPYATAAQNVWFAQRGGRRSRQRAIRDPMEVLGLLGLGELADLAVASLPRGEQQQVALAAGVAAAPRLLLADEPTSQLDPDAAMAVIDLLASINAQFGTTVVLVTHDPVVAAAFPRTVTIRDGRVGSEGLLGVQYVVVDGSGSVQLPPEVLELFPPRSRLVVERTGENVLLRPEHIEGSA
jgi:putative ABC transport system ATP-binding protein